MFLSELELSQQQQPLFEAGYVAMNNTIFSKADMDGYNAYTLELNRERCKKTREFLLDQRHRYFCLVCGLS